MSENVNCKDLNEFDPASDLGYWDVEPKSFRVNCSETDVTLPLMVYGLRRDEVTYRVVNPQIASASSTGELTLGSVRGVTLIVVTRKDDPCDVRYVQAEVTCPCDQPLNGCRVSYQTGGEPPGGGNGLPAPPSPSPSPEDSPPQGDDSPLPPAGEDCDGGESVTLIVSGFTGDLAARNGAFLLVRAGPRVWVDATQTVQVRGTSKGWRIEAGIGTDVLVHDPSPSFRCSQGHPVGSGALTTPAGGQSGRYTLS